MNKITTSIVYTVHAYRWGDRELHSYIVGIYSKKLAAQKAASAETNLRGGKYHCEIREWALNQQSSKVILELPGNTLRDNRDGEGSHG